MNIVTGAELANVVLRNGGIKEYNHLEDNYFIVFDNIAKDYTYFTVNDSFQAPERLYMTEEVATKVAKELNTYYLKDNT